jgi:hypothetical protein
VTMKREQNGYWDSIRDQIVNVGRYSFGHLMHLLLVRTPTNPDSSRPVQEALWLLVLDVQRVSSLEIR